MAPLATFGVARPGARGAEAAPKLDPVKIAIEGGDARRLDAITPFAAPFEIVPVSAGPDLVWDAHLRQARSKGEILAFDVGEDRLPEVVDRVAMARGLAKLAAARPQPISVSGSGVRRKGDRIEVELADMRGRALVLFAVSGDGLVQALYPIAADPRVIDAPTFRWTFQIREPFGTDLIVAVSAPQPMDALESGVRELSRKRAAAQALQLVSLAAPPDARIGLLAVSSAP